MPSNSQAIYTRDALDDLTGIKSKRLRSGIRNRIIALSTFPQSGLIDSVVPPSEKDVEHRVTFVAPYAIRYSFIKTSGIVRIDAITNERSSTPMRFL